MLYILRRMLIFTGLMVCLIFEDGVKSEYDFNLLLFKFQTSILYVLFVCIDTVEISSLFYVFLYTHLFFCYVCEHFVLRLFKYFYICSSHSFLSALIVLFKQICF